MALNNLTRVTGSGFGTETSINTTGIITAASFSGDGSSLTGVVGSGSGLIIQEEGSNVGTAGTINFVGTGVTATMSGAVATIEITSSGGGGGGGGLSNVVEDTTPQLGGNLDANSKDITGVNNLIVSGVSTFTDNIDANGNLNVAGISTFGSTTLSSLSVGAALDLISTNSSSTIQANNSSSPFYIQGLNNNFISILAGLSNQGRVTLFNQGKVEIAHAGNVKFETTSTGAEITGNLTATSFSGDVTGTATTATNVTVADESSDTSCFLLYSTEATGNIAPKTGSNLTFNSSSGTLSAATFVGDGSGLTGITASGSGVIVRDGGSLVGTAGTIDFGTNVSVSPISAGVVTVTAAAGTIAGINTSGTTELNNLIVSGIATFPNNIDANGNLNLAGEFQLGGGIAAAGSSDNLNWGSGNFYFNSGNPELGWVSGDAKLVVRAGSSTYGNTFSIQGRNARDNMAVFTTGGGADLYYNDVKKFETTGIGITVTGTTFTNNLSVSGITTLAGGLHIGRQVVSSDASSSMILGGADDNQGINFTGLNGQDSNSTFYKNIRVNKVGGGFRYDLEFHSNGYSSGDIGDFIFYRRQTSSGRAERMRLSGQTGNLNVVGIVTASSFKGSGATLTTLNASELDSGTIPDARFPATLPAVSGANLTNLPGSTPATSDITIAYELLNTSSTSNGYRISGNGTNSSTNNPDLYLIRGQNYRFINNSGGSHPFRIQSDSNSTLYTTGVTNNNSSSGNIDFAIRYDAPARLYYKCGSHPSMLGNIIILGDIISEGSWTASAGTAQTIDTITGAVNNGIKTAEYTVHIENGSNMQAQKVLVMQDGTTAFSQEYAIMHKSGLLVSMSATISGGDLLLQATPETGVSGTTTYKVTHQVV